MQNSIKIYQEMRKKLNAYYYAMWVMSWDSETELPHGAVDYRSEQIEVLTNEIYALETNKTYLKAIDLLYLNREKLDDLLKREIEKVEKELRLIKKMPKDEYIDYQVLL